MSSVPRLLDQVRERIRVKHYSFRTKQVYVQWIRRYILYHGKRHPRETGAAEVEWLENVTRAKWAARLPVVLTREEVRLVLA